MSFDTVDSKASNCVSAHVTSRVYREIVEDKLCNDGHPCMRDECEHCGPLNRLVDLLGEECDRRGCTLRRCIFDD